MTEPSISDPGGYLLRLIAAVNLLALPSSAQISWLEEHNYGTDEALNQLQDCMPAIPVAVDSGLVSPEAARAVTRLSDYMLGMMSNDRWLYLSDDALTNAPQWQEVRMMAAAALKQLPGRVE